VSIKSAAARIAALDDGALRAAFREAADTPGPDHTVIHHLAAIEMTKRGMGLGKRTAHHRKPVVLSDFDADVRDVNVSPIAKRKMPAEVRVVTVLDADGISTRVMPVGKAKDIKVGEFVSWNSSGGTARGQVERIVRTGSLDVPDSSFTINADPEDPALLIRIWRSTSEGNAPTERLVGHRMSTVRKVPELTETVNKTIREQDGQWCVYSADGSRSFGCYDTEREANARLRQIEAFKSRSHPIPQFVKKAAKNVPGAEPLVKLNRLPEKMVPAMKRATVVRSDVAFNWLEGLDTRVAKQDGMKPPARVRNNARRALRWIEEGKAGKGFTSVGRRRAQQLAAGEAVSVDTIERMRSYFSRHEGDKSATGFKAGQDGYPSPGRVAWDAWGGDEGRAWANQMFRRTRSEKGYVSKAVAEQRYTLGPMYIPNSIDAQGEWTDEEELQQAVWRYVRSGDRRIRLQHNRDIVAGEWVECMAWPYPVELPMVHPDGTADVVEFPANTVFLGVIWEPWAWDMVKAGSLRGYSIGGAAARVLADLPEAADSAA
jgi:hypothetical protein